MTKPLILEKYEVLECEFIENSSSFRIPTPKHLALTRPTTLGNPSENCPVKTAKQRASPKDVWTGSC